MTDQAGGEKICLNCAETIRAEEMVGQVHHASLRATLLIGLLAASSASVFGAVVSGRSPECGPIVGEVAEDLAHVKVFCTKAKMGGVAVSAYASGSLLWVKVSKEVADEMRSDRLMGEQAVKMWTKIWVEASGESVVTVYVKWMDVEIAEGHGNARRVKVTFHL